MYLDVIRPGRTLTPPPPMCSGPFFAANLQVTLPLHLLGHWFFHHGPCRSFASAVQCVACFVSPSCTTSAQSSQIQMIINLLALRLLFSTVIIVLSIAGKVPEWLKSYVELFITVSLWIKVFVISSAAWIVLSVVRAAVQPPYGYWVYVNVGVCFLHRSPRVGGS